MEHKSATWHADQVITQNDLKGNAIVLQVDLSKTDQELVQTITLICSKLGVVKVVRIHRNPAPFALIEMANHNQTLELAGQYGGSAFGNSALVHLEQADAESGRQRDLLKPEMPTPSRSYGR